MSSAKWRPFCSGFTVIWGGSDADDVMARVLQDVNWDGTTVEISTGHKGVMGQLRWFPKLWKFNVRLKLHPNVTFVYCQRIQSIREKVDWKKLDTAQPTWHGRSHDSPGPIVLGAADGQSPVEPLSFRCRFSRVTPQADDSRHPGSSMILAACPRTSRYVQVKIDFPGPVLQVVAMATDIVVSYGPMCQVWEGSGRWAHSRQQDGPGEALGSQDKGMMSLIIAKFMGPIMMGPNWGRQDPGGPHVGPMTLAI